MAFDGFLWLASVLISCVIGLILLLIGTWFVWYRTSWWTRLINRMPGPVPLPIVGSALQLAAGCPAVLETFFDKWTARYGEIFRVYIGLECYVFVSSPEHIDVVLNNAAIVDKGQSSRHLRPWLGDGISNSSGDKWKCRRRQLSHAFHTKVVANYVDTFNEQSLILCSKLLAKCRSRGPFQVDVFPLLSLCTLDMICESALGFTINAQGEECEYVIASGRMAQIVTEKSHRPWLSSDWLLALTDSLEQDRCLKTLHPVTDQVINKRRSHLAQSKVLKLAEHSNEQKSRKSFLDWLLESAAAGEDLSDEDIKDEMNTLITAGHETSAAALSWFLYCMAANPEHQERVHEELDDLFAESDRYCTQHDLVELKYLDWCIKEALRLYPSVPFFDRLVTQPLQLGGYQIPAGCNIRIFTYAVHHNPRFYPHPGVFNPHRFTLEHSVERHPFAYIPFGAGHRSCIGQRYAQTEVKIVLSTILRRFKFELPPLGAQKPKLSVEMVLKPQEGIHLMISARK